MVLCFSPSFFYFSIRIYEHIAVLDGIAFSGINFKGKMPEFLAEKAEWQGPGGISITKDGKVTNYSKLLTELRMKTQVKINFHSIELSI